jgi:hypothetical protein
VIKGFELLSYIYHKFKREPPSIQTLEELSSIKTSFHSMSSGEDISFDGESSFITFKTNKTYKTLVTNKSQKNNLFILK